MDKELKKRIISTVITPRLSIEAEQVLWSAVCVCVCVRLSAR